MTQQVNVIVVFCTIHKGKNSNVIFRSLLAGTRVNAFGGVDVANAALLVTYSEAVIYIKSINIVGASSGSVILYFLSVIPVLSVDMCMVSLFYVHFLFACSFLTLYLDLAPPTYVK